MIERSVEERVRQRRAQMLVHSDAYYNLGESFVSDDTWQRWAQELVELQRWGPVEIGFYDEEFADWDGSTGMHLPVNAYTRSVIKLLAEGDRLDALRAEAEVRAIGALF